METFKLIDYIIDNYSVLFGLFNDALQVLDVAISIWILEQESGYVFSVKVHFAQILDLDFYVQWPFCDKENNYTNSYDKLKII
jgi:hypothetical protein